MKAVIQRVTSASVSVDNETVGQIGNGYVVLLGVGKGDTKEHCEKMADKIINLRIFEDENGKINLSLKDVGGQLLIISQFTLYADCKKRRPGFIDAAPPDIANELYEYFKAVCKNSIERVECGIFGAHMNVKLENDGPFTVCLEI